MNKPYSKKLDKQAKAVARTMKELLSKCPDPTYHMLHVEDWKDCKVIINAVAVDKAVYPDI